VNLHELENNFMSIMQGYMVDRKLEIITDSQPLEVDYVLTDGLRLRQVVLNILSNAVKYTPDGKNIIYRTENRLSDDSKKLHMKYTIADSGIGMSQEFLKKIYEPFSQVERDGVHSNYKGTGLGMVIVKSFVDMLGGTIEIQSEVNVGTVVTLNFEFDIDPHPVKKKTEGKASADKTVDLKNVKIMLVEDNDINREIAVELLKSMNMEIIEAVDGEDAVNKFRKSALGEYKCIFMDIMMPVMNGYEATKAIRSMDRDDAKSVPIIAMTANAFMEDVKMSKECGMNEHISKPIDPERVKEVVAKYLVK
jgi:CheY-like chemotaxis protein